MVSRAGKSNSTPRGWKSSRNGGWRELRTGRVAKRVAARDGHRSVKSGSERFVPGARKKIRATLALRKRHHGGRRRPQPGGDRDGKLFQRLPHRRTSQGGSRNRSARFHGCDSLKPLHGTGAPRVFQRNRDAGRGRHSATDGGESRGLASQLLEVARVQEKGFVSGLVNFSESPRRSTRK